MHGGVAVGTGVGVGDSVGVGSCALPAIGHAIMAMDHAARRTAKRRLI
jgi:hypothetical protein